MTLPSDVLPLQNWKLTLPSGPSEHPTELTGAALIAASIPATFWADPDGSAHFRAPVTGVTTSGSDNPRCELREMLGGSLASWSSTDGKTHTMVIDQAVIRLPNPRSEGTAAVVAGQIHDAKNDISVFRVEQGKVWVTKGNDTHFAVADSAYVLGTRFRAMFVVTNDVVSAYYNGKLVVSFPLKGSGWYFRAGAYVQANAGNSKPAVATNYGETAIYSVTVAHGAPLPGSDPEPPVVTPPVVDPTTVPPKPAVGPIMVLRHGEKPSSATDHTLSPKGQLRAAALPPLFTVPRTDLHRPTWIFASKGNTTSQRMVQTATPTAAALGLPIDTSLDSESAVDATAALLVGKAKAGETVLAVLEHSCIPAVLKAVAKLLGMAKTSPKPMTDYPDDRFDLGVKFEPGTAGWVYSEFNESVLPGDIGFVAPPPVVDPPPVDPPVTVPPVVVDPPADPPVVVPPVEPEPQPAPSAPDWWQSFIDWLRRIFGTK
jgi:hypothetical protein